MVSGALVAERVPPKPDRLAVEDCPAFIADAMLGRLARWLRLAGYDTLYDWRLDDNELVRLLRLMGRTLLTRDTRLVARPRLESLLVRSQVLDEQLSEIRVAFGMPKNRGAFPRCPEDNTLLVAADRYEVEGLVPAYVWVKYDEFHRCPECGRAYWPGTHYTGIRRRLERGAEVKV